MLFNSHLFIFVFLPCVLIGYFALSSRRGPRWGTGWLVVASLLFYGYWNPVYIFLLTGSVVVNFVIGSLLSQEKHRSRGWLTLGIVLNLGCLGYFKYTHFILNNLHSLADFSLDVGSIALPLAISFFTFQQITYLVDIYRGEVKNGKFSDYCLFVTFFPQLIAGPIVHHREMMPQFLDRSNSTLDYGNVATGLSLFAMGLFKKVVIADGVAEYANPVFALAHEGFAVTFLDAWLGAFAFTFQIYFDFSGYSDMALGLARMFNIRLPVNFDSPYQARSITDFWRRWHMTLTRFLRDYIYIPLGGNRRGESRRYGNVMTTMLLCGLWHGASWNFVIWGGLNGFYLVVNRAWQRVCGAFSGKNPLVLLVHKGAWVITLAGVILGWVLFRAETLDGAWQIYRGMFGLNGVSLPHKWIELLHTAPGLESFLAQGGITFHGIAIVDHTAAYLYLLGILVLVKQCPNSLVLLNVLEPKNRLEEKFRWAFFRPSYQWIVVTVVLLFVSISALYKVNEFIYFQF
jgi:D-alanyl-lipoteichoic acid acyltransferase DltB (MBOAT superfamily)